jgi:hypothetical protein
MTKSSGRSLLLLALLTATFVHNSSASDTTIDASKETARIRPFHGANGGPLESGGLTDLTAPLRPLALPSLRLHDCHWPNPDVVDMHVVFPNPTADPTLPQSYDFTLTDDYLRAVLATGAKIVYRLGESIDHRNIKPYVHPPADRDRWAAACVGIARHYNEGWAQGFHHGIQYWEIWNEPDNRPAMWSGTDEDYLQFYEVTAKALKAHAPDLKVGGPALGYTGTVQAGKFEPSHFLRAFLSSCRDLATPLDFFSWHWYGNDPADCLARARGIRAYLDANGFAKTESHLTEWNYLPDNDWTPASRSGQGVARERFYQRVGDAEGAASAAAVLIALQDAPVDAANYFKAGAGAFGLFTEHGVPRKTYFAFQAFAKLVTDTSVRIEATSGAQGPKVCAGINQRRDEIGVLIAALPTAAGAPRQRLTIEHVPWDGPTTCEIYLLDAGHDLVRIAESRATDRPLRLEWDAPAPAVTLVKLRRGE